MLAHRARPFGPLARGADLTHCEAQTCTEAVMGTETLWSAAPAELPAHSQHQLPSWMFQPRRAHRWVQPTHHRMAQKNIPDDPSQATKSLEIIT